MTADLQLRWVTPGGNVGHLRDPRPQRRLTSLCGLTPEHMALATPAGDVYPPCRVCDRVAARQAARR